MKKLTAILAVFFAATITPVHAIAPKTLAIIDSGVDMSMQSMKNNVIYQVCIAGYKSCPNGTNLQEGAGAANVTPAMYSNTAWSHGTYVASAAIQTDPNVQIIEIRCASLIGANGFINCNENMMADALNWVNNNKDKFNIGAVVSPIGFSNNCSKTAPYLAPITKLNAQGIPLMFPTGNDFKYTSILSPACNLGVMAISAIDDQGRLALYANYSPKVDFAALGNLKVAGPGNVVASKYGTSLSVAVFGTSWLKIYNVKSLTYADEYNLIKNTSTPYTNIMVKQNVLAINMVKALQ